jgi:hypothetical protein
MGSNNTEKASRFFRIHKLLSRSKFNSGSIQVQFKFDSSSIECGPQLPGAPILNWNPRSRGKSRSRSKWEVDWKGKLEEGFLREGEFAGLLKLA